MEYTLATNGLHRLGLYGDDRVRLANARRVEQIDRDLETLESSKAAWARLPVERKIAMLESLKQRVYAVASEWVDRAVKAKGLAPDSPLAGEEWMSGPWAVLYALNRYLRTLRAISQRGEPDLPPMHRRRDGRVTLRVFPHGLYDRALLNGIYADVWMQQEYSPDDIRRMAGDFYRLHDPPGRVALILGAGNISSIAPLDVLYKMLNDGCVCMLKMNPVNAYLGPILERAFEPFVDGGYLRFAYGGADVGEYLSGHPAIEEIHITGSERTHSAIVNGAGAGKPITSELGNVSPTIVLPGPWRARDIEFQAQNIATQKAHNAGFNCIASQVLVLPEEWQHSDALRNAVARIMENMDQRPEYYPGATQRRETIGGAQTRLRTIVDIDANELQHPAFTTEAFCGVLACVRLRGNLQEYTRNAVTFANDRLHGTLGANLIAHPATIRQHAELIDEAVEMLRYGCVGINAWTGVGYFVSETPWGAYPGHTLDDIQSGIGVVHNSYLLRGTEKSVVRAPFAPFPRSILTGEFTLLPKPPWFVTNRRQSEIAQALCDFEMSPSPFKAAGIAALAFSA